MSMICGCLAKNPDKAVPEGITWGLIEMQDYYLQKVLRTSPVYYLCTYNSIPLENDWLKNKIETSRENYYENRKKFIKYGEKQVRIVVLIDKPCTVSGHFGTTLTKF